MDSELCSAKATLAQRETQAAEEARKASACEALRSAVESREIECLRNAIVEAEAAGLEGNELSAAKLLLSDQLQKAMAMAWSAFVQGSGIDALKAMEAVVQQVEAAGLGDPLLSQSKAVLVMMRGIADESGLS